MPTPEDVLQALDDLVADAVRRGLAHNRAEDEQLDGRTVTVGGRPLVNFGSCSYLGLETHPALKEGVRDAVERFGTQFSSSRAYISAPPYQVAEHLLSRMFGQPVIITPSTTMAHIATVPTVVGSGDALLLDHQAHHSVQTAAKLARLQGTTVDLVPHSNLGALERRLDRLRRTHRRVWYAVDGLYSMYADFAPIEELNALAERHEQLWLYIDDAHAVSWTGRNGRGYSLEHLSASARRRSVVAASLNKSFAAGGGAVILPDEETRRRVFSLAGPMIFSGPLQPPMLGAILASARLHLGEELPPRQQRLAGLIGLFNGLATDAGLPLVSASDAPIRCVGAGTPQIAYNLVGRLRDAGFYTNPASYPAVPAKRSGARLTITAHHSEDDIRAVVGALAVALPAALTDEGSSPAELRRAFSRQLGGARLGVVAACPPSEPTLTLDHRRSIAHLDPDEWDAMFGDRGAFTWQGLRVLEETFARPRPGEPENHWDFHYWVVRDRIGRPVAATFFTRALWKDDMLSAADVSAQVEQRRVQSPYYLTSTMLAMGSLLTEGDHLYRAPGGDWRAALRLILRAARLEEDRTGAAAVVLRDIPDGDGELHDLLLGEGFVRLPVYDSWVRDIDFKTDDEFLAGLSQKARYHQRRNVLGREAGYDVEVFDGARGEAPPADVLDHLHGLYRNVHARNLDLNVFPLPRRLLSAVAGQPGWELVVLRLAGGPSHPVAFAAQHVTDTFVQPVFVGLDYDYVASEHSYQQTLWQAVRSAQRRGARRVLLGMSADLQKRRFGAQRLRRWVYVQPTDSYNTDVLAALTEGVQAS